MDVKFVEGSIIDQNVDAVVLGLFSNTTTLDGAIGAVDAAVGGQIAEALTTGELSGSLGEVVTFRTGGALAARRAIVVGLGSKEEFGPAAVLRAAAVAIRSAMRARCRTVASVTLGTDARLEPAAAAQLTVEGALIGGYRYRKLKTVDSDDGEDTQESGGRDVESFTLVGTGGDSGGVMSRGANTGSILGRSVNWARDLAIMPGNLLGPGELASQALQLASTLPLSVSVLDADALRTEQLNLILAVGGGSARQPVMIAITYKGRGSDGFDIAFVGKGLTFDSGGLQIKPGTNMGAMKGDMAGSAAVLGAAQAIAQLRLPIDVLTVIPAAESLLSGTAMRPGDVVRSFVGKTVEIADTDAEGRLILADAVAWAERQGARAIIDVATLTGACISALGNRVTGMFSSSEALRDAVIDAGAQVGERYWELPLVDEYRKRLVSDIADVKNHVSSSGSLVLSALFIQEFVRAVPWAHLDVAGTSSVDRPIGPFTKGPTGVPVRTLVALAERIAARGGEI